MSSEGRIALTALIGIAIWLLAGLPLINFLEGFLYLPRDRLEEVAKVAPLFTSAAASIAAFVAFLAFLVALGQLSLNRKNQRETTAKTNFREFLKLCSQHPDFAYGKSKATDKNRWEYEWFVAQLLWATEEVLEFAPQEWRLNLRLHIAYHREYLKTDPRFIKYDLEAYDPTLQKFLRDVLNSLPPTYDPAPPDRNARSTEPSRRARVQSRSRIPRWGRRKLARDR